MSLPNLISLSRILFIPPFVICVMQVQHHNFYRYIALGMLVAIGLSDILDGYLARKRGEITKFGKYIDPIADKLILTIACILLSSDKLWPEPRFPNWIPAIVISREFLFLLSFIGAIFILKRRIDWCPNRLGRLTTFLQVTAVIAVLIGNHLSLTTLIILWWLVAIVTFASAVNYMYKGVKQL
ncbi:MAG: CDP-alcohol phosphatidyltransferase family protein [Candidatus Scalinduaceae bacterium]